MSIAIVHDAGSPYKAQDSLKNRDLPLTRDDLDKLLNLLKNYTQEFEDAYRKVKKEIPFAGFKLYGNQILLTSFTQKQKNLASILRKVYGYYEQSHIRFSDEFEVELRIKEAEALLFASQKEFDYTKVK